MNNREIDNIFNVVAGAGRVPLPPLPRKENPVLAQLKQGIAAHDKQKYPTTHYKYQKHRVEIRGRNMTMIAVEYDGQSLGPRDLLQMRAHSLATRKLSILAGVVNAIELTKGTNENFITPHEQQRNQILKLIEQLSKQVEEKVAEELKGPNVDLNSLDPGKEMNVFLDNLIAQVGDITGSDKEKIIRDIRLAERYFVADYKSNQVIYNETKTAKDSIIQIDVGAKNNFTQEQREEYIRIHAANADDRPAWFNILPGWEKRWFLQNVPKSLDDNWEAFESKFMSSAMAHCPGINNARTNYLYQRDKEGVPQLVSTSIKTGTMAPYEMPKQSYQQGVEQTAQQVLSQLTKEAQRRFSATWEGVDLSNQGLTPLVLSQGLLSDTIISGSDTRMVRSQEKAIKDACSPKGLFAGVKVFNDNVPVNFLRFVSAESGLISKLVGRWDNVNNILAYTYKLKNALESAQHQGQLNPEQIKRLDLIREARSKLIFLRDKAPYRLDRNMGPYKAAYTAILVEACGGMVSTNCKSGKDRTGLDELYRNTMMLYYQKYGELPAYNAAKEKHQKFMEIYETLFDSQKAQEAAATNTPGSFGLKDSALMLCRDIAAFIGKTYRNSNMCSVINKPKIFTKDENLAAKQRTQRSMEAVNKTVTLPSQSQYDQLANLHEKIIVQRQKLPPSDQRKTADNLLEKEFLRLEHLIQQIHAMEGKNYGEQLDSWIKYLNVAFERCARVSSGPDFFTNLKNKISDKLQIRKPTNDARFPEEEAPKTFTKKN